MASKTMEALVVELVEISAILPKAGEEHELYASSSKVFQTRIERIQNKVGGLLSEVCGDERIAGDEERLLDHIADLRESSHVALDVVKGVSNVTERLQAANQTRAPRPTGSDDGTSIRPQLSFQDPVDNSDAPFRPKLINKPHAIVPLKESVRLERSDSLPEELKTYVASLGKDKNTRFYRNPYEHEIRVAADESAPRWLWDDKVHFPLRERASKKQSKHREQDSLDQVPFLYVDDAKTFQDMESHIIESKHEAIAIDLEHHSYRSYQGFTCVMQISTWQRDFVVDALKMRGLLPRLLPIFADPTVVKVLHGADYDVEWLQKDFGLYLVQMFDTGQAARILGYDSASLAYCLDRHCKVTANKALQLADWRIRPLTADMVKYAREDTHFLLGIFDAMRRELSKLGTQKKIDAVQRVIERSADIASKAYGKPEFHIEAYTELFSTGEQPSSKEKAVAKALYSWRNSVAREEDESVDYVLPARSLLRLAKIAPRTEVDLLKELEGISASSVLRSRLGELMTIIENALGEDQRGDLSGAASARDASINETKVALPTLEVHNKFYCGVNESGVTFEMERTHLNVMLSGIGHVDMTRGVLPLKNKGLADCAVPGGNDRIKAINAKLADMIEEEMHKRMQMVDEVKSHVDSLLQDVQAASPDDEESSTNVASMSERYHMRTSAPRNRSPGREQQGEDDTTRKTFQYTRDLAVKVGAVAPKSEPEPSSKKKQRISRWEEKDEGTRVAEKTPKPKVNPYILKPSLRFGAKSTSYMPK